MCANKPYGEPKQQKRTKFVAKNLKITDKKEWKVFILKTYNWRFAPSIRGHFKVTGKNKLEWQ